MWLLGQALFARYSQTSFSSSSDGFVTCSPPGLRHCSLYLCIPITCQPLPDYAPVRSNQITLKNWIVQAIKINVTAKEMLGMVFEARTACLYRKKTYCNSFGLWSHHNCVSVAAAWKVWSNSKTNLHRNIPCLKLQNLLMASDGLSWRSSFKLHMDWLLSLVFLFCPLTF